MKQEIAKAFGLAIRHFRLAKGFSQEELSSMTNIGRSFLSELETGRKIPTLLTIYRLADALDLRPTEIVAEVDKALTTSDS